MLHPPARRGGPRCSNLLSAAPRRGGRAVECAGLENRYTCKRIGGSNPPLSVSTSRYPPDSRSFGRFRGPPSRPGAGSTQVSPGPRNMARRSPSFPRAASHWRARGASGRPLAPHLASARRSVAVDGTRTESPRSDNPVALKPRSANRGGFGRSNADLAPAPHLRRAAGPVLPGAAPPSLLRADPKRRHRHAHRPRRQPIHLDRQPHPPRHRRT